MTYRTPIAFALLFVVTLLISCNHKQKTEANVEKVVKKQEYIQEFMKYGTTGVHEFVLPLDAFFEWADSSSIGYNLCIEEPYIPLFYQTFKQIRDLDEVEDIYVKVVDEGLDDEWFSSDTVYVIGSISKEKLWEIMRSVQPCIAPDDIIEGWSNPPPSNIPCDIPSSKVLSMWWD